MPNLSHLIDTNTAERAVVSCCSTLDHKANPLTIDPACRFLDNQDMSSKNAAGSEKTKSQIIGTDNRWEPSTVPRIPVMHQMSGAQMGRITLLDTQLPLVIGRETGSAIHVSDDICSRRHAEVRVAIDPEGLPTVLVRDLKSSNGTEVDGARLAPEKEFPWTAGQTLDVGGGVRFHLSLMRKDDAEALEWVSRSSHRDRATGLLTRRGLLEALEREAQHLARHPQESIAVVILRIFDFADELVAQKVDRAMRHWVERLLPRIRSGTILGRTSDYEVTAILRHCDTEGAHAAMTRYQAVLKSSETTAENVANFIEPAIGGLIVTGKYNPSAEPVLRFAESEIFKFGHPGDKTRLIEYVPKK